MGRKKLGTVGPVVWCKKCSRRHARRLPCELYLRERIAKSGRKVARWCH